MKIAWIYIFLYIVVGYWFGSAPIFRKLLQLIQRPLCSLTYCQQESLARGVLLWSEGICCLFRRTVGLPLVLFFLCGLKDINNCVCQFDFFLVFLKFTSYNLNNPEDSPTSVSTHSSFLLWSPMQPESVCLFSRFILLNVFWQPGQLYFLLWRCVCRWARRLLLSAKVRADCGLVFSDRKGTPQGNRRSYQSKLGVGSACKIILRTPMFLWLQWAVLHCTSLCWIALHFSVPAVWEYWGQVGAWSEGGNPHMYLVNCVGYVSEWWQKCNYLRVKWPRDEGPSCRWSVKYDIHISHIASHKGTGELLES